MHIVTIVGARPQFIKAATVSRELRSHKSTHKETIIHTGQHYDENMSNVFFRDLEIPQPNYNLGIGGGTHGQNTGRMLEAIEKVLIDEKPDTVLVYGDTDSTLAGGLAASKLGIPVAHVEAGLRSFNRNMPEELNRIITDHISDLLFTPTIIGYKNLRNEGIDEGLIHLVGDVMYDAVLYYRNKSIEPPWFASLRLQLGGFVLCTIHRAENADNSARLSAIFQGLGEVDTPVILPLHPRTKKKIKEFNIALPENIYLTDPVGYLEMVWLEANCRSVATDSGGVQKEAYFFGKPCVTLRDETEWLELVDIKANFVVGADPAEIGKRLRDAPLAVGGGELYGSGDAAERILECIISLAGA
jgi:UDP-GlcNAc3NAcA epimerase